MAASVRLSLVSGSPIGPVTEKASSRLAMHRRWCFGISHFFQTVYGVKNGCFCAFIACALLSHREKASSRPAMHRLCSFGIQRGNSQVSPGSRRKRDVFRLPKPRPESSQGWPGEPAKPTTNRTRSDTHDSAPLPPISMFCHDSGETCSWKLAGRQPAAVTQTGRFASSSTEVSIAHWSGRRLSAATCLEQHGRKALRKQTTRASEQTTSLKCRGAGGGNVEGLRTFGNSL